MAINDFRITAYYWVNVGEAVSFTITLSWGNALDYWLESSARASRVGLPQPTISKGA